MLLTLDPNDLEEPHAERLLGDELRSSAPTIRKVDGAAATCAARSAATSRPRERAKAGGAPTG